MQQEVVVIENPAELEDLDSLKLEAQQIELEHRRMDNVNVSECTLQTMLNQPYIAPVMVYQKKAVLPRETAYIQKASAYAKKNGGARSFAADKLVK